jgi:hypothetical protein
MAPSQQEAGLSCGVVFGIFLATPLAISGILGSRILDSTLKWLGLIAVSSAAYYLAYMAAVGLQMNFPQIVPETERWDMGTAEPASPTALFVGGLVGGFLIFVSVVFLAGPRLNKGARSQEIIRGALLGGALGIAGWALRSSIGVAAWNLFHSFGLTPPWELSPTHWYHGINDYGERTRMYSLYIVWQTGIAAATGIMLRYPLWKKEDKSDGLRPPNF